MKTVIALSALILVASIGICEAQTFTLAPDSTITLLGETTPESVTGSFIWTSSPFGSNSSSTVFVLSSLNFQSLSFSLSLDPQNDVSPDTFSSGRAYFDSKVVDAISGNNFELVSSDNSGSFTGSFAAPTSVLFPNVNINDASGTFVGTANIDAIQAAPEPSTCWMILGGLAVLVFRVRRRLT